MNQYRVNFEFRKGPSYSADVKASREEDARSTALKYARYEGFNESVRSIETEKIK